MDGAVSTRSDASPSQDAAVLALGSAEVEAPSAPASKKEGRSSRPARRSPGVSGYLLQLALRHDTPPCLHRL